MKQILKANDSILKIVGKPKLSASDYRFLHYTLSTAVEEGILLFNMLTRELLLLTQEEFDNALEHPYLRQNWFVVSEDTDEKKLVNTVRWLQKTMEKKPDAISTYTIYTTTDCNARCFYCFELGRKRTPMSEDTARKTADYIKKNCGGKPVCLRWFGGEPLYNDKVIDIISDELRAAGIPFKSRMISNGYLFDEEMADKAKNSWNLKLVQITLDGTEEVYNRCKAFIYRDGSAYQIVTKNIERLLDRGISVVVRMNMDFHNIDDLLNLSDELAVRFGGRSGFLVYTCLIIDEKTAWDNRYTMEQWQQLYDAKERLDQKLAGLGILSSRTPRLNSKLQQSRCMAEDDSAIVITPDGCLGVCEHYSESDLVGHLDSPEQRDQAAIANWRQRREEIPECDSCFYYPECNRLKKCPYLRPCIELERNKYRSTVEKAMVNELRRRQNKTTDSDADLDMEV